MDIIVSEIQKQDIPEVLNLLTNCWPDYEKLARCELESNFKNSPKGSIIINWVVAKINKCVVGAAGWSEAAFSTEMYELCASAVREEMRHKGIGTLLLDYRLERINYHAQKRPYCVIVQTWDNPLYNSRGFVAGFKDVIQHPEGKSILMARFV